MKIHLKYPFYILFLLLPLAVFAQYLQVNNNYTAQQLVQALVDNSCAQVSNVSVNGWSGSSGGNSYGYFTRGTSNFPFENGIVLSTGFAASVPGPNNTLLSEGSTDWLGDSDLEQALNINNSINATVLEFDFIPFTDEISFDYIFASEQYLTSITSQNQCNYTDGFAFLLKEAGSTAPYQNLAVIPGTNIPVKVNTVRGQGVCPAANEQYFAGFNGNNHPINFNGQTVIMKARANVTAGTLYHIKLVVADQGNHLYDSAIFLGGGSFNAVTNLGTDRLMATGNPLCQGESLVLDASNPSAIGYQWYNNNTPITGATNATYTVTAPGTYSVAAQLSATCFSRGEIKVEYAAALPSGNYTLLQCDEDNDNFTNFNLTLAKELITGNNSNLSVSYFSSLNGAETNTSPIQNPQNYTNTETGQTIYARITNQYGCYSIANIDLAISNNNVTPPTPLEECDTDGNDDGFFTFDLTSKSNEILTGLPSGMQVRYYTSYSSALTTINAITNPQAFINTAPGSQTIYARIINGADCYDIVPLQLTVYSFGTSLNNEIVYLCGSGNITLNAGTGFSSYKWNTDPVQSSQSITVSQPGNYTVTVTNSEGCEGSKTFTVTTSGSAVSATIAVNDFAGNQNSITIQAQGPGNYEYSLNGSIYQDNPVFEGLIPGIYTIYIKDKNGCPGIYTETVYVMDYPKFFTPNGDGINDTWTIPYLAFQPDAIIYIFDRYGKLITSFSGNHSGWDGTFKGRMLPSTDYWFVLKLSEGKTIKGHFSMVR